MKMSGIEVNGCAGAGGKTVVGRHSGNQTRLAGAKVKIHDSAERFDEFDLAIDDQR